MLMDFSSEDIYVPVRPGPPGRPGEPGRPSFPFRPGPPGAPVPPGPPGKPEIHCYLHFKQAAFSLFHAQTKLNFEECNETLNYLYN